MNETWIVVSVVVAVLGAVIAYFLMSKPRSDEKTPEHRADREHKGSAHFRFDGNATGKNGDR